MTIHYIYLTTNKINGMMYIGQRKLPGKIPIEKDSYLGSGTYLNYAIKKYSRKNFEKTTLEFCCDRKEADLLEIKYFKKYKVLENRDKFYNRGLPGQYWRHEGHSKDVSIRMKEFYKNPENKNRFLKAVAEKKKLTLDEYLYIIELQEKRKKFNKNLIRELGHKKFNMRMYAFRMYSTSEWDFRKMLNYLRTGKNHDERKLKMPGLNPSERTRAMWQNKKWRLRVQKSMRKYNDYKAN
jgi:hypothetical protein